MGLPPFHIFEFFQCGDRLYTSGLSLSYKDGSRVERVKLQPCQTALEKIKIGKAQITKKLHILVRHHADTAFSTL